MPRNLSPAEIDAFRARLCAVAQQRFARDGVDGVTMRQLAEALGCSPMTPYRYFHDKDEILAAVRAAAFDRFADALEAARRQAGDDPRAAGQSIGEAYVRFALADPDGYRLMFDLAQPHPERYPDLLRATERARQLMSAGHEGLVKAGIFVGDPRLLGYVFWATLHGLVVLRLAGKLPETPDFDTIYAEAMRVLVAGARSGAPGLSAGAPLTTGPRGPAGPGATSRPRPEPRRRRRTP